MRVISELLAWFNAWLCALSPGSTARSIQVDGDTQKNITGRNVGDIVTANCTVESCVMGTYRIRFIDRKNIEISNRLFNETRVTDTVNIVLGTNSSGLYKCEVVNAVDGKVEDTATFELIGAFVCVHVHVCVCACVRACARVCLSMFIIYSIVNHFNQSVADNFCCYVMHSFRFSQLPHTYCDHTHSDTLSCASAL